MALFLSRSPVLVRAAPFDTPCDKLRATQDAMFLDPRSQRIEVHPEPVEGCVSGNPAHFNRFSVLYQAES
jgi:hypothetical protein